MKTRSVRIVRAALCAALGATLASTAQAQAGGANDEKVTLEKFIVTGTLIPIAAGAPAIPVKTIGAADIERTGLTTDLADILRRNQPTFYGNNNIGSDRANVDSGDSNGGSAVSLRNRTTLVLINGRRANLSPAVATGGSTFVDVSMIPVAAIERIEVLSDGASATYGSDAVSGVINIILKSNYSGMEIGSSYGFSTNKGHWENRSAFMVAGGSSGNTNLTVSMEWKRSDPLIQYERPFSTGLFRTPTYAGVVSIGNDYYYLNPSSNAPNGSLDLTPAQLVAQGVYQGPLTQDQATQFFDLASYPTLLLDAERRSLMAAVEHKLTRDITLFADGIYTINNTESVLNAQPVSGTVAATNPLNPFNVAVTARNRFVTYPRIYAVESNSMRGVAGVRGRFADSWTYEGAVNLNKTNHYYRNKNLIDGTKYAELVAANSYNPFARVQAPGIIESMGGTQVRDYVSTFRSLDARVSGDVFDIPGGPVKLGLGVQYGWTELDFTNDRNDQTGNWLQATPRQPFNKQMNQDGYFAEVRIPVFSEKNSIRGAHTLEVTIAGRKEIYSNTEDPMVPKYSVRYLPFNNELAFRGSYSESFVAPTLYELYGPLSVGFTPSLNITRYNAAGTALGATGNRQYRSQGGSNPNLRPAESRNWSAGVVWSPKTIKGFSMSLDWFAIDERDVVDEIAITSLLQDVERRGTASPYAALVRRAVSVAGETHFADGAPITAPGQVTSGPSDEVWVTNNKLNLAGLWQQGLDLSANYKWDMQDAGRFNLSIAGTYLHEYYIKPLPSEPAMGVHDGYINRGASAISSGLFPRFRLNNRLDWSLRNWTAGIGHTFLPSVDDLSNSTPYRIARYHRFDLQLGHNFTGYRGWLKGLQAMIGVNNVFNKFPPLAPSEGNQSHDINAYDPIGRFIYVQARYKF